MSVKSFFTSFFDSLSDWKSYFEFKRELLFKNIEEEFFNSLEGKRSFVGMVLQIDQVNPTRTSNKTTGGGYTLIKVRPIDIHELILPEPCAFGDPKIQQEIVDLHPTAYSEGFGLTTSFAVGDTVECYFDEQGPEYEGKLRGLRFRDNAQSRKVGFHKFFCLKDFQFTRASQSFQSSQTPPSISSSSSTKSSNAARQKILTAVLGEPHEKRTVQFSDIMFKASDYSCRPKNKDSDNLKEYLGEDGYKAFIRLLGYKESGGNYNPQPPSPHGYSGKYQFSIENMTRHMKVIKRSVGKKYYGTDKKLGQWDCHNHGSAKCHKEALRILNAKSSWSGHLGVNSHADFLANKGNCQERGMVSHSSSQFKKIIKNNMLEDRDNIVHVVAMLCSAHLKGFGGARSLYRKGYDKADGNGMFPSMYYVEIGEKFLKSMKC